MEKEEEFKDYEEIINEDEKELLETEIINDNDDTNYDEVLQLTEYDGNLSVKNQNSGISAEYNNIDIVTVEKKHRIFAKTFVQKITKFITEFKDYELNDEHTKYIKQVGELQLENLADLLTLVDINRSMLNNIILRVNSVQAEDYAMLATYNSLLNQHLKLLRELQNAYKTLPSIMKKMRIEVISNQELLDGPNSNEVITEDYGTTQFNNQKEMLKTLKDNYKKD